MLCSLIKKIKKGLNVFHPSRGSFGSCGKTTVLEFPIYISCSKSVYLEDDLRIRQGTKILISDKSKLTIKKYSVIGMNNMIVPNKHTSTVGIPQFLLGTSGINDQQNDVVIEEDVWTGSNVTLLGNANLGRGCLCGACSVVTKPVPPYAVVVGSPAKIVAVKFSIDQIIEHEKILYPEEERYSREYLEDLFDKYYKDIRIFGVTTEFTDEMIDRIQYCAQLRNMENSYYVENISQLNTKLHNK